MKPLSLHVDAMKKDSNEKRNLPIRPVTYAVPAMKKSGGVRRPGSPIPVTEPLFFRSPLKRKHPTDQHSNSRKGCVSETLPSSHHSPHTKTSSSDDRPAGGPTTRSFSLMESNLVENLRKQVSCMEAQIGCLKQQIDKRDKGSRYADPTSAPPLLPNRADKSTSEDTSLAAAHAPHEEWEEAKPMNSTTLRVAGVPQRYWSEMASLEFNLERMLLEHSHLQEVALQAHHENREFHKEMAELQATLRSTQQELQAVQQERQVLLDDLHKEKGKVMELEGQLAVGGPEAKPGARFEDMVHQRDFYKLQTERLEVREQLLAARYAAFKATSKLERDEMVQLKSELVAATQRIQVHASKQQAENEFYADLGLRFVSIVALMRRVMDEVRESGLHKIHKADEAQLDTLEQSTKSMGLNISPTGAASQHTPTKESSYLCAAVPPPGAAVPAPPPGAAVPAPPPGAVVPAPPPGAAVPAPPPGAAVPAPPPGAAVPAPPPGAAVPAPPPGAAVPAPPPGAVVPAPPPGAAVPAPPPGAEVPAPPPGAVVPAPPPGAVVPAPPPGAVVPAPPSAGVPLASTPCAPAPRSVEEELAEVEQRIAQEEEELKRLVEGCETA